MGKNNRCIGYCRVSTTNHDLSIQRAALEKAGCHMIVETKITGTKPEGRDEFDKALGLLGENDARVLTA